MTRKSDVALVTMDWMICSGMYTSVRENKRAQRYEPIEPKFGPYSTTPSFPRMWVESGFYRCWKQCFSLSWHSRPPLRLSNNIPCNDPPNPHSFNGSIKIAPLWCCLRDMLCYFILLHFLSTTCVYFLHLAAFYTARNVIVQHDPKTTTAPICTNHARSVFFCNFYLSRCHNRLPKNCIYCLALVYVNSGLCFFFLLFRDSGTGNKLFCRRRVCKSRKTAHVNGCCPRSSTKKSRMVGRSACRLVCATDLHEKDRPKNLHNSFSVPEIDPFGWVWEDAQLGEVWCRKKSK